MLHRRCIWMFLLMMNPWEESFWDCNEYRNSMIFIGMEKLRQEPLKTLEVCALENMDLEKMEDH